MSEGKPKTIGETFDPAAIRSALSEKGLDPTLVVGDDSSDRIGKLRDMLNSDPSAILDREGFLPPNNPEPRKGAKIDTGQGLLDGAVFEAGDEVAEPEGGSQSFRIDPGHAVGTLAFLHVMIQNGRRISMKARSKGGVRVTVADINFDGDNLISALMRAAEAFAEMEGGV